jgi:hypothetical protein
MDITFTKTGERTYATLVRRDDGVLLEVPSYDRPSALPHDLAHYIVEQGLGLSQGFWGSVAAGAMFGLRLVSGRRRPHADERSRSVIKEAGQRLTEAEGFVFLLLEMARRNADYDWRAAQIYLSSMWQPQKGSRRALKQEELTQVCEALREAEESWKRLAVGESFTVTWKTQRHKLMRRPRHHHAASRHM